MAVVGQNVCMETREGSTFWAQDVKTKNTLFL